MIFGMTGGAVKNGHYGVLIASLEAELQKRVILLRFFVIKLSPFCIFPNV